MHRSTPSRPPVRTRRDAAAPGADAPAEPLTTGTPTNTQMTALTDLPDPAPVSTAGPIAPAGNIDQIVPEVPVTTAPAVALTDTADFGGQVVARIAQVTAVQATATLPGEISGPAVAVTVEITNSSAQAIGLDSRHRHADRRRRQSGRRDHRGLRPRR